MNPRQFPPGINWLPAGLALVLLLVVSFFAVKPHYTNSPIITAGSNGGYGGGTGGTGGTGEGSIPGVSGGGGAATGTSGGYVGGTQGHSVGGSGGQTIAGTNGRTVGGTNGQTIGGGTTGGGSGAGTGTVRPPTTVKNSGTINCARGGNNGGATAPGVTANQISVASTIVTTGVGAGFLGSAQDGIQAAINQFNAAGGACGRTVKFTGVNSGWDYQDGGNKIQNFINSGNYFALVGQPDSEGLENAIKSQHIDNAGIPVVGTDGMLKEQYQDPWVWPVAASTVTNMHIIAQYAVHNLNVTSASDFGIVYDTQYQFGAEGANAFSAEVQRLTGSPIPGHDASQGCTSADKQYCGINSGKADYSTEINNFDSACAHCKVVVMLLEPQPMENWMKGEENCSCTWFKYLFGGEPLFDDLVGQNCQGCGEAPMQVWTGYDPAVSPFASQPAVASFCAALHNVSQRDDCHNEFTEGAYIGTKLFLTAVADIAAANAPLTRENLRLTLDSETFDLGMTPHPLHYGSSLPHLTNTSMTLFQENYSGAFNGWSYWGHGFVTDADASKDI